VDRGREAASAVPQDPHHHLDLLLKKLGGKIEELSCKDLIDLSPDLYYLILQKLKEKALELEERIDKWRTQGISTTEISHLNLMEKTSSLHPPG